MTLPEDGFVVNDIEHLQEQCPVYGVYDTEDNCWIGDDKGPRLFTVADNEKTKGVINYEVLAKLSAQITNIQMGYKPGRLVHREYKNEDLRLRDTLPVKMSGVEAIIIAEGSSFGNEEEITIDASDLK